MTAYQLTNFFLLVIVAIAIAVAASILAQVYLKQKTSTLAQRISSQKALLTSSDNRELERQVIDLNNEIKTIESLNQNHYAWSKTMTELARLLPSDMRVTTLSIDRETGKLAISGTADNRDSVLRFWMVAKKSSFIKEIDFPLSNLEKPTTASYNFSMNINLEKLNRE